MRGIDPFNIVQSLSDDGMKTSQHGKGHWELRLGEQDAGYSKRLVPRSPPLRPTSGKVGSPRHDQSQSPAPGPTLSQRRLPLAQLRPHSRDLDDRQ